MTIIGLTGGIAAGKSTAAEILREFGATVIDADRLGHRSYEPGTPGFQKVVNAFGHDIVARDGTIDRRILGGKVFGAPGQLERLNAIVWPEIRSLIQDEVKQIRSQDTDSVIVLEAAVLLEAGWEDLCDEVWVVVTPVQTAVERLKERNGLSEDAAMARINAQMSNKERTDRADVKIENSSSEDQLRARVERAWKALVARTGRTRPAGKATKTGSVKASPSDSKPAAKAAARPAKSTTTRAAAAARPATTAPAKAAATKAPAAKAAAAKTSAAKAPAVKASAVKAPAAKAPAAKASPAKASPAKGAAKPAAVSAKAAARPAAKAAPAAKPATRATSRAASKDAPKATAKAAPKATASAKAAPKQSTASKSTSTGGSKAGAKTSRAASGRAR